jgi:outer membrane receptor for ferrienterochelin and colicins
MLVRVFALAALVAAGTATAQTASDDKVLFGDLPAVEAVSLHAQSLAEAPANVNVITAAEIRRYGYRTLAEALASVAGFYVTYDHQYHYVGVSGISLPGDFNTRFLVMLNGHPLTDNIYNSNGFFGQDFGLDMDLVDRIEIIRGPTSALYGSNGILANINVVTRSPVDAERLRISAETDSAGERKLGLSASAHLGHGANLLVSGSVFNDTGIGVADGERGYHTFAQLIWRGWSFTGYFNSRDKQAPVGVGSSLTYDPRQYIVDSRNFASAVYRHSAGPGEIQWQTSYDQYRYHDRFDYPADGGIASESDVNRGDWLDSQLAYDLPLGGVGRLTVGGSATWDLRAVQYNLEDGVRENYSNRPERGVAFFAQQEWKVSPRWQFYGGLRLDETRYYGRALSPRVAAVFQQSARSVYKLVYGRPFRNPSAFEQFYNDGGLSYAQAPPLRPETASTFEASMERRVAAGWTMVVSAYHYDIARVIEAVTLAGGAQQYRNTGRDATRGAEFTLAGKLWDRLEASAGSSFGHARGGESQPLATLANSPAVVSKVRLAVPLGTGGNKDRFFLAGSLQYLSARDSWTGARLGGAPLADFTFTARVNRRFELQAGVRNAFDRRYEDPIFLAVDRLPGDGRTAYLRLVCRVRD